ncbi:hypothetical protein [Streptomyces cupreus]|uniref:Uncharacterized protein n=1 Tax=Streptomyces cupreus TaxID=2759956 RepID=A0A7X1MFK0_9ACTN|nr:hypothetical protein [Streptomyces cupreus]MBC2906790.1 hypothetical protein [Streptomyces cupreus]
MTWEFGQHQTSTGASTPTSNHPNYASLNRSNIPKLAEFTFTRLDPDYARRAADLANFGVLPLEFDRPADYDRINPGDRLRLENLHAALAPRAEPRLRLHNTTKDETYRVRHHLSDGRRRTVLAGGTIAALAREEQQHPEAPGADLLATSADAGDFTHNGG